MVPTIQLTSAAAVKVVSSWKDVGFERPWSCPGHPTVESGGDAFKTGRVTDALVQCPMLCPIYFTKCCNGIPASFGT